MLQPCRWFLIRQVKSLLGSFFFLLDRRQCRAGDLLKVHCRWPRCPTVIMTLALLLLLLGTFVLSQGSSLYNSRLTVNDRPIIGILAQETHFEELQTLGRSYIAASYVKTIESAGARVTPILILFPGGAVDLVKSEYARVAKLFYNWALEANTKGDYFPVWGTCLGFEELTYLTSGEILLTLTETENISLPLNFTPNALNSKLFKHLSKELYAALSSKPLTANFHYWSLSMQNFTKNEKLSKFYNVLTTNSDGSVEFISTFEAYDYPIYGVQWHPEKNPYEWKKTSDISHSSEAVKAAFYMAEFFVDEARKNSHHFTKEEDEANALIYNYFPKHTGNSSVFEQMYFF